MMKKRILAFSIAAMLCCSVSHAQSFELENVSDGKISGLMMSPDQETFCTIHIEKTEEEGAAYFIAFYNHQMMEMKKARLDISVTSTLLASKFSGEIAAIVVADADKKTRTLLTIDRQGNIMQKKEEENVLPQLLKKDAYIGLYSLTPSEFVMVTATRPDGTAYSIERFSMVLDVANTVEVKPEKGKITIEQVNVVNDNVYLLCRETSGLNSGRTDYVVKAISTAEGKVKYSAKFGDGSESGLPGGMRVNNDMTVDLTGLIFNEGDFDKAPDGIIWGSIDVNGNPMYTRKLWPELLERNNNKIIKDLSTGKLNVLLQDRFRMPGSENIVLLGETFEKSNGGAGTANFTIKDFVLIKFTTDGEFANAQVIEKTPKLATVRGTGATGSSYLVAEKLHSKNYFTYRTNVQAGDKANIVYRYNDGKTDMAYTLSVSDSLVDKKGIVAIPLNGEEGSVVKEGKQPKKGGEKGITPSTMEIDLDNENNSEHNNSLTLMKENHALVQRYKNGSFSARIIGLPVN